MQFTPTRGKVLVRLEKPEEVSRGGIHIPQRAQQANEWGVVCACGEGVDADIQDGAEALVLRTQGTHFRKGGQDFIVIEAKKIKAIKQ